MSAVETQSVEYLCTIVSWAVNRATKGLKITWPAGEKHKVIVWINIYCVYTPGMLFFRQMSFNYSALRTWHISQREFWGWRDRLPWLWRCSGRRGKARGGCGQGGGSGSMKGRRPLPCKAAGFKFRTPMRPSVKSEMYCWKYIISFKWLPCKSQEWKLAWG